MFFNKVGCYLNFFGTFFVRYQGKTDIIAFYRDNVRSIGLNTGLFYAFFTCRLQRQRGRTAYFKM